MNSSYKPHEASRLSSTGSYIEEVFNNVLRSRQDSVSSTSSSSDTEELDRWLWRLKRQSSEEELEAAGEVSDCMYHVAKGGTHGPNPRLRMFLPALNKVLCSNRVSQMTKTYNDIEAVTRLLEEKEKDIELTARIGKELLTHNQKLETNVASLETELRTANEKITQLTHELQKKTELIQILTNDYDDSGSEAGTPTGQINFEVLQRRVCRLEEENVSLRHEASQLAAATEDCELQEAKLVADLASQLALARTDLSGITLDADQQRQEAITNKAKVESLTQRLSTAEIKIATVTSENDELVSMINIARETQCELAIELSDMKEKYAEVMNLLQEAQEGLRRQRKKMQPHARGGLLFPSLHTSLPMHNPDSLATELECSLFSELSLDSGIGASSTNVPNYKKVFETVRCASRGSSLGSGSSAGSSPGHEPRYRPMGNSVLSSSISMSNNYPTLSNSMPMSVSSSQRPRISSYATSRPPLMRTNYTALDSAGASDSESSEDFTYISRGAGDTQTPAASDLEAALRRLTPGAVAARRAALGSGLGDHDLECRTPDSIMSTGSSGAFSGGMSWKLPDKLQIVKPIEGSVTLHHWSELATPSLGGLLEERPGVKVRGGTELEALGLELYSLSDLEEDDEEVHPGKSFQDTGHIYTYTNSTVMHPDDNTSVTHSLRGSQMCTASSSRMSTAVPTPIHRSRRNSTSTYSTALGLAKMLNERGIKAVTPSTLPTPMFSPTATPANSPDHSPSSSPDSSRSPSPSPSPAIYSPLGLPGFLMSSGAELLRRTLVGTTQKPSQHRSRRRTRTGSSALVPQNHKAGLTGIRLVETLERIGLERIMSTTPSPSPPIDKGVLSQPNILPSPLTAPTGTLPTATVVKPLTPLGVPGRPGSGALESRLTQIPGTRSRQPRLRPDLGTVPGKPDSTTPSTSLGTLSSMLFGRKGGLL